MLHIFFNYTELHRLKEAVFVLHMVNVGYNATRVFLPPGLFATSGDVSRRDFFDGGDVHLLNDCQYFWHSSQDLGLVPLTRELSNS